VTPKPQPKPYLHSNKTAVIIEPREHKALNHCVRNVVKVLPAEWKVQVFGGPGNRNFCYRIFADLVKTQKVEFVNTGRLNFVNRVNVKCDYSRYMCSMAFWNKVKGEHVLIFQTDSVLCPGSPHTINSFLRQKYDYIGAPWPGKPLRNGCGGLSLRTKSSHVACVRAKGFNPDIGEDVVFSNFCRRSKRFRLAPGEVARKFCVGSVYYEQPFAVHQFWPSLPGQQARALMKRYPDVAKLVQLQNRRVVLRPVSRVRRFGQIRVAKGLHVLRNRLRSVNGARKSTARSRLKQLVAKRRAKA